MRVLEGHPFIVEAAVSLGGRDIRPGINVYRFANRIPLLFEVRAAGLKTAASSLCSLCDGLYVGLQSAEATSLAQ